MRILTTIVILFLSQTIFGQEDKKTVYIGLDGNEIRKGKFKKLDSYRTYSTVVEENDSILVKQAFSRKKIGRLDSTQLRQIKIFLSKIIGLEFDERKNTMIHLYNKTGKKVEEGKEYERYWDWIENNSDEYQAFLIGTKNSGIETDEKNHLYLDSYNLLKRFFFMESPFDMNHLYLKPNGEFYIYYGGKDILGYLDWSL